MAETLGNPVSFACDATGIPPPSLAWLKNGRPIGGTALHVWKWEKKSVFQLHSNLGSFSENPESLEMHVSSGGGKLQIARSQVSDGGTYTCVASNVEGDARKSYRLSIQGTCAHMCTCAPAPTVLTPASLSVSPTQHLRAGAPS